MFGRSRKALEDLQASVSELVVALHTAPSITFDNLRNLEQRLDEFELSRAKWQAEMEAALMKADGRYKAAMAAESRARTLRAHDEKIADEITPVGPEAFDPSGPDGFYDGYIPAGDAAGGPADGVHGVPVGMEANSKAAAMRGKFA